MMIILLALVPSVLFVLLFYLLDPNRKPLKVIGKVAAWSLVAFVPTTIMVFLMRALHIDHWLPLDNSILLDFDHAFLRAAIPEEVGKLLALWGNVAIISGHHTMAFCMVLVLVHSLEA